MASQAYPRVAFESSGDVTHDKASLEFALDEPGVVHYVVLLRDQTYHAGYTDGTERQTPSAAEIRAGRVRAASPPPTPRRECHRRGRWWR